MVWHILCIKPALVKASEYSFEEKCVLKIWKWLSIWAYLLEHLIPNTFFLCALWFVHDRCYPKTIFDKIVCEIIRNCNMCEKSKTCGCKHELTEWILQLCFVWKASLGTISSSSFWCTFINTHFTWSKAKKKNVPGRSKIV